MPRARLTFVCRLLAAVCHRICFISFLNDFIMKTTRKSAWQGLFKSLLLFALLVSGSASYSFTTSLEDHCMGPAPINLEISSQTSNSVSFTWDGVDNPDSYKIWYYRSWDNYTSTPVSTENEFISFSNLPAGTYDFFFVAIHGETASGIIGTSDLIME